MFKKLYISLALCLAVSTTGFAQKPVVEPPDLERIKAETTDESSRHYYPRLLQQFLSNDTVMTVEDYRYFYYGTLFQEDYDPYRKQYDEERYKQVQPLYYQASHTNAEKDLMLSYAIDALHDNPVDLQQLKYRVYAYEHKNKENLRNIWRSKLNHLLFVIATSGTGLDKESPWIVVYPSHEFDFLNIQGLTVTDQEYEDPHYERVTVKPRAEKDPTTFYFDLAPILEQYYLKHPTEQ